MTGQAVFEDIATLFAAYGDEIYGEAVSIAQHSLQTAALARAEGASETLCVAALLHDGHFLGQRDDRYGYHKHDRAGGEWLAERFPAAISEPVRLHVAAKRYLCATDAAYHAILSEASQYSLSKQGGPMSAEESAAFAERSYAEDAVRLRRWDDRGKVAGIDVPVFESYRAAIERLAR